MQNNIPLNVVLNRVATEKQITQILLQFDTQYKNLTFKKGIYIYGASGCGKTCFITDILTQMNYDIIKYDAGDTRNKNLINTITSNHISSNNVLNMMSHKKQKMVILMDEIEAMNNGDKGGITSLIKLIRQKKTKRQKQENQTFIPIICIGNYYTDKKIKELMKVCHVFELKTPTPQEATALIQHGLQGKINTAVPQEPALVKTLLDFCQGDLRKIFACFRWMEQIPAVKVETICELFNKKMFNYDTKKITKNLLETKIPITEHNTICNETDRTIIALLWHENVIDYIDCLNPMNDANKMALYHKILKNICFADYIDRITFQNQIWQFNEMSLLIKTIYNNKIYHETKEQLPAVKRRGNSTTTTTTSTALHNKEIRFTKVLTKYSTEYNNLNFIYNMCNRMDMDKKDMMAFFLEWRYKHGGRMDIMETQPYQHAFETAGIGKLDVRRIYRYLDQNDKKAATITEDETEDDDDEDDTEEDE